MGTQKLLTAGGGGVNLTPASSIASDVTVQIPSQNCTLGIQGPAFSATSSANTSASNATWTKLQLNTEQFDTNTNFDNSTNYRFTPSVAGYYQINAQVLTPSNANLSQVSVYKNGASYAMATFYHATTGVTNQYPLSTLVYLNGSSDYIELYGWQQGGTILPAGAAMNGTLVRAA